MKTPFMPLQLSNHSDVMLEIPILEDIWTKKSRRDNHRYIYFVSSRLKREARCRFRSTTNIE